MFSGPGFLEGSNIHQRVPGFVAKRSKGCDLECRLAEESFIDPSALGRIILVGEAWMTTVDPTDDRVVVVVDDYDAHPTSPIQAAAGNVPDH
jgi:hypothetical protein